MLNCSSLNSQRAVWALLRGQWRLETAYRCFAESSASSWSNSLISSKTWWPRCQTCRERGRRTTPRREEKKPHGGISELSIETGRVLESSNESESGGLNLQFFRIICEKLYYVLKYQAILSLCVVLLWIFTGPSAAHSL